MLDSQLQILKERTADFLSIGITEDGAVSKVIGVPWWETVHAYSMCTPDVYMSPEDLLDERVMRAIERFRIIGCYIWAQLDDYSILSKFKRLKDLNIHKGGNIRNLDFLKGLTHCEMFFLRDAKLKNLDPILDAKTADGAWRSTFSCVALYHCEVEDVSRFERENVRFSEFLVCSEVGKSERERWNAVKARTFQYFER